MSHPDIQIGGARLLQSMGAAMKGDFSMSPIAQSNLLRLEEGDRETNGVQRKYLVLGERLLAAAAKSRSVDVGGSGRGGRVV